MNPEPRLSTADAGRRALGIAVVSIQFLHASCAQLIGLVPAGHVDRGVTFTLHDADGRPLEAQISDFVVYEEAADDKPREIWYLHGSQSAKVITYGQVPRGLTAEGPAQALTRGSKYHAVAVGSGRFAGGGAAARFTIDTDGTVVVTSEPVRGPRPSDKDMDWLGRHGQRAVDALMPVDDPAALVLYRSQRALYYSVVERYFSIRYGEMPRGFDRDSLQATVVAPIGRSIQAQMLDLHMKDRGASFESVLLRVSVRRASVSASTCPAIRAQMDSLPGVPLKPGQWDVINIHPVLHRIVTNGSAGRIEATLENDAGPLVVWATETYEALLKCAG